LSVASFEGPDMYRPITTLRGNVLSQWIPRYSLHVMTMLSNIANTLS
jgi:hypothetical protein